MNNIKQLKDQQRDVHPGFDSYLECQTRTLVHGLSTFALAFSTTYFAQKLLGKRLPYSANVSVLVAALVGSTVSYKVTKDRTEHCQAAWMAFENKHTALKSDS